MSYKKYLAPLVKKYVDGHTPHNPGIEPLTTALGCLTCAVESCSWRLLSPSQPPEEDEDIVLDALLRAMRLPNVANGRDCSSTFAVLDGLGKNQRWRACLRNGEDAFSLATMLVCFISHWRDFNLADAIQQQRRSIETGVLAVINEWLHPEHAFICSSSREMLAQLLFGEAWCALFLSDEPNKQAQFLELIITARPPLRTELLAAHLRPDVQELPLLA